MGAKQELEREVNPPYISQNVWHPFFKKMQTVKKPDHLTIAELKEYGLAGGQGPALQSAIKFLGLVDSQGRTTEKFKLIQVAGEQFKKNLSVILDEAYADLFSKHPLVHASYEDLQNYFAQKYSPASAKKMAKSFAVLCQLASIDSPAFDKMRALDKPDRPARSAVNKPGEGKTVSTLSSRSHEKPKTLHETDALIREFIRTNPLPTSGQWDAATLKAYFDEYRKTIAMLQGEKKEDS
jgi:hypothetical protein